MSLGELRQNNKQRVIETALTYFVEKGIYNTKVSSVAKAAGLTERSVYRYFESKADLVLEAALLFWDSNVKRAQEVYSSTASASMKGAELVREVLLSYANLYFTDRKKLIFSHEAEIFLCHEQSATKQNNPPLAPYKSYSAPLSKAIRRGVEDGSLRNDIDFESMYNNAYDSLLGLMQKMALSNEYLAIDDEIARRRLYDFCNMLAATFMCEPN